MTPARAAEVYAGLHAYAAQGGELCPGRCARRWRICPESSTVWAQAVVWDDVRFLCEPAGERTLLKRRFDGGRQDHRGPGGRSLKKGQEERHYPVSLPGHAQGALEIFRDLVKPGGGGAHRHQLPGIHRQPAGLQRLSKKQRRKILKSGIKVFEFRPDPAIRRELIERYPKLEKSAPIFAIHAKSMVIDNETLFVGTFNFDPRSANLNTEVGVLLHNPALAGAGRGADPPGHGPGKQLERRPTTRTASRRLISTAS